MHQAGGAKLKDLNGMDKNKQRVRRELPLGAQAVSTRTHLGLDRLGGWVIAAISLSVFESGCVRPAARGQRQSEQEDSARLTILAVPLATC